MAETKVRERKRSASRKAQLLEIAAKIFAEEGYKETGIERILKQAGLTGPALYRHFSSKQEILDTICVSEMQTAITLAREVKAIEGPSAEERLRHLLRARIHHLFSPHGYSSLLAVSQRVHLSESAREQVRSMQQEFRSICGALLREIRPKENEEELQLVFFAAQNMLIYTLWRARARGMLSEEDLQNLLEKMIWSTLLS